MLRRVCFAGLVAAVSLGAVCTNDDSQRPQAQSLPQVKLVTSKGAILIELFTAHTSAAVKFKELVEAGYYDNTIFHEVRKGKWIIGGQYDGNLERNEDQTLVNDSANGLRNLQGRVSLYGSTAIADDDPHVPQFLINLADNPELDQTPASGQPVDYTVIGRLVRDKSLSVANAIGNVGTTTRTTPDNVSLSSIPVENVVIERAEPFAGPVADAGEDRIAVPGLKVELGGSEDELYDPGELTYAWEQTGGVSVALSSKSELHPTFTVPQGAQTLTFSLTVTDTEGQSDTDAVTLTVDHDFITTNSGLMYKDVITGSGETVSSTSFVRVLYTGRLASNWKIFDSTANRNNQPSDFLLDDLIPGWQEGIGQYDMRVGGKRLLIIPPDLGYGDRDQGNIPGKSTLYFEVEVVELLG